MESPPLELPAETSAPTPALHEVLLRKLETARKENNVLQGVVTLLLTELQTARGHQPTEPLIVWPSGLSARTKQFTLALAKGKEVFSPQARLEFASRPQDDVDRAMVLRAVSRPQAPVSEPKEEKSNLVL